MTTKGMKFPERYQSPTERFSMGYIPEPNSGCWIWLGNLSGSKGYGYIDVYGKPTRAHRYSYELHKGKIPNGLVIDHLCKMSWCVNPDHLEAVTQKVNMERGANTGRRVDVCVNGHPKSGNNLYIFPRGGNWKCRECTRASVRKYQKRKREERDAKIKQATD